MSTSLRRSQPVGGFGSRPAGPSAWNSAIVVSLSTAIFAVIALAIAHLVSGLPNPARQFAHTVPNIIGMDVATVEDRASTGISVRVLGQRPSEQYPRGVIIQQSPVAGWHVGDERVVRVTVSEGLVAPDVIGLTRAEAEAKLARLNWTFVAIDAAPDAPVRLQHPAPGLPVDAPGELSLAFEQ